MNIANFVGFEATAAVMSWKRAGERPALPAGSFDANWRSRGDALGDIQQKLYRIADSPLIQILVEAEGAETEDRDAEDEQ